MNQELFVLIAPEYGNPYGLTVVVNGELRSRKCIPIPECPSCGRGSYMFCFAKEVSDGFRKELERLPTDAKKRRDLSVDDFFRLRREWSAECAERFHFEEIPFGASFPKYEWQVPSTPSIHGMYWCLGESVIGGGVRQCFDDFGLRDVEYSQVEVTSIGTLDPHDPKSIPFSDDVNELLLASEPLVDPSTLGEFYFIEPIVDMWKSDLRSLSIGKCKKCGQFVVPEERYEILDIQRKTWEASRVIPRRYAPNADLFRSNIYCSLVVSPRLFEAISDYKLLNFDSFKIKVVD